MLYVWLFFFGAVAVVCIVCVMSVRCAACCMGTLFLRLLRDSAAVLGFKVDVFGWRWRHRNVVEMSVGLRIS